MSVFFVSRKTGFKSWLNTSLIPLRYLAVCQASSAFSYCNPDSFLIPGGLIELLFLVLLGCFSTPASVEIYCWHYLSSLCNPKLISFDISLNTSLFSLPNFLISLQSLFLKDFSSFFKNFFTW